MRALRPGRQTNRAAFIGLSLAIVCATGGARARAASPPKAPLDACKLLTSPVVEQVLDSAAKQARATSGTHGSMIDSQCFYAMAEFANSVSLSVSLPSGGNDGPRELWEKRFHDESEKEGVEEKESETAQAVPVPGLGDEAFWVRSFVGTLYVLQGDAVLRISLGGKWDDSVRLQKATALAKDALQRLRILSSAGTSDSSASHATPARSGGSESRK